MKLEDCYQLGHIVKPHGLSGEVILYLDVDFPDDYSELESVLLLRQNQLIPFFLESIQLQPGSRAIVKLEDISSRDDASDIAGAEVYLPLDNLPPLEGDQFYYHEIIEFEAIADGKVLGKITGTIESGLQDLFTIAGARGEILIPITDDFIDQIDFDQQKIHFDLPEGYLDIYLNDPSDEN